MTTRWKLAHVGPALVFSSGNIFLGSKKPKGLSIEDVIKLFTEHPNTGYYEVKVPRVVTLGEAVDRNFNDMGKKIMMYTSIDFHRAEHDRIFKKLPKTGGQLMNNKYESETIHIKEEDS